MMFIFLGGMSADEGQKEDEGQKADEGQKEDEGQKAAGIVIVLLWRIARVVDGLLLLLLTLCGLTGQKTHRGGLGSADQSTKKAILVSLILLNFSRS